MSTATRPCATGVAAHPAARRVGAARWLPALTWLVAAGAWAQGTTALGASPLAAERARIADARAQIAQQFAREEQACHQRFAVNDCLNRNLAWQRAALADLRRQEILLNDGERQRQAAERLERLDDKGRARVQDQAERPHAPPRSPNEAPRPGGGKLPREADAPSRDSEAAAGAEAHRERMERKHERNADAQAERDEKAAQAADEARRHAARVREAEQRKANVLRRNAEEPSKAQPLPSPAP